MDEVVVTNGTPLLANQLHLAPVKWPSGARFSKLPKNFLIFS